MCLSGNVKMKEKKDRGLNANGPRSYTYKTAVFHSKDRGPFAVGPWCVESIAIALWDRVVGVWVRGRRNYARGQSNLRTSSFEPMHKVNRT